LHGLLFPLFRKWPLIHNIEFQVKMKSKRFYWVLHKSPNDMHSKPFLFFRFLKLKLWEIIGFNKNLYSSYLQNLLQIQDVNLYADSFCFWCNIQSKKNPLIFIKLWFRNHFYLKYWEVPPVLIEPPCHITVIELAMNSLHRWPMAFTVSAPWAALPLH